MIIQIFLDQHSPACIELPEDLTLAEPDIKQYIVQYLPKDTTFQEIQNEVLRTFNSGNWEVVDDEGDILIIGDKGTAEPVAPQVAPAAQSDLMLKIEQLQESQSAIKQLQSEIATDTQEVETLISRIESKQAQLESMKQEQRVVSKELIELQKLLNELLMDSES